MALRAFCPHMLSKVHEVHPFCLACLEKIADGRMETPAELSTCELECDIHYPVEPEPVAMVLVNDESIHPPAAAPGGDLPGDLSG